MKSAQLKVEKARWWVMQNSVFYGQLCMALADEWDSAVPLACTNGKVIKWNPKEVDALTNEELRYLLIHETMHCAHGHPWRFPSSKCNHVKANIACDHAINLELNDSGLAIKMPDGMLADPSFINKAEEEIYRLLPDDGGGGGYGPSGWGRFDDSPDGEEGKEGQAKTNLRDEWRQRVIQAAHAAHATGCGHIPADIKRILEKIKAQPLDWRRETADFARTAIGSRSDWTRSPRRHAHQDIIYPRRKQDEPGMIVAVRDTSGSIDDKVCGHFSAHLSSVTAELGCEMLVIDCDAAIHAEHRLNHGELCPLTAEGGGGTDFRPPFERVKTLLGEGENVAGVIYLTDLFGPEPEEIPVPTLWVCTTDRIAKTGRTVKIEID